MRIQQITSFSVLLALLLLNFLPHPAQLSYLMSQLGAKDDYPCAGHQCGCVTAEICRTNCCCARKLFSTDYKISNEPKAEVRSCCSKKKMKRKKLISVSVLPNENKVILKTGSCYGDKDWSFLASSALRTIIVSCNKTIQGKVHELDASVLVIHQEFLFHSISISPPSKVPIITC
ncbi:MAG: hypothetical protein HQL32_06270 [Planctomycetes bacterium]|nr:hypothetical protein [Planctomycetota bacterium]